MSNVRLAVSKMRSEMEVKIKVTLLTYISSWNTITNVSYRRSLLRYNCAHKIHGDLGPTSVHRT